MPKPISLAPLKSEWTGSRQWYVNIPASISPTGKRVRYFFESKGEAATFCETQRIALKDFGIRGNQILSPAAQDQAAAALDSLKPYGIGLNEVVQDWITKRERNRKSETFSEAGRLYREWMEKRTIRGRPVSGAYLGSVRQAFKRAEKLDGLLLSEIDDSTLANVCDGMAANAKNTWLAIMSAFFKWCAQLPRRWIAANPTNSIPRESVGGGEVKTFCASEVRKILAACTEPDLLAYHVLGFFAGIRPDELARMTWDAINLREKVIVLSAGTTKTRTRRVIEITDTLEAWIKWIIRRDGRKSGEIISTGSLKRRLRLFRKGLAIEWIHDGMRHTYASNWLAAFKDEHRLRANLGHKSSRELWDHYHKATTEREAKEFWAIRPPKRA